MTSGYSLNLRGRFSFWIECVSHLSLSSFTVLHFIKPPINAVLGLRLKTAVLILEKFSCYLPLSKYEQRTYHHGAITAIKKSLEKISKPLLFLEPAGRFELPTCALRVRCSTPEPRRLKHAKIARF